MLLIKFNQKHFACLHSTQDYAKQHAYAITPTQGLLVTADTQLAGKGTHGRTWHSPPGGVYATFSLLIPKQAAALYQHIPQITCLTLINTLLDLYPGKPSKKINDFSIKWANDVLLKKKKLAGILCETEKPYPSKYHKNYYLCHIGIGINLIFPDRFFHQNLCTTPVIALTEVWKNNLPNRKTLLQTLGQQLLTHLKKLFEQGFEPFYPIIHEKLAFKEKKVTFLPTEGCFAVVHGILQGIDLKGQLILKTKSGKKYFSTGRLLWPDCL